MSRAFDDASSQYLELDSAPVTAAPFTVSCWFNSDDITATQALVAIADKDVANQYWALAARGAVGGDPVSWVVETGAGAVTADTSTGYSASTWHHACAVETSATSRAAYIDGGSKGTDTTSRSPSNADRVSVGRLGDSTPGFYMSGNVAEVAIWNVALSDAEVALLAKGFSPLFMQPENLVAYWPLVRDDDNDWVGGYNLADTNTPTVATHPPVIAYPTWVNVSRIQGTVTLSPPALNMTAVLPSATAIVVSTPPALNATLASSNPTALYTAKPPALVATLTGPAPTLVYSFTVPLSARERDTALFSNERDDTLETRQRDTALFARKKK